MSLFEEISAVRKYYHMLKYILKEPKRKGRRLIAVDETIVRVGDSLYGCIDVETKELFGFPWLVNFSFPNS